MYKIGVKIYHGSVGKYGRIESRWLSGDGPRYEVRHSGWLWSVPQRSLASTKKAWSNSSAAVER